MAHRAVGNALRQMPIPPSAFFHFGDALKVISQGILGDDLAHAQLIRIDSIAAYRSHMRITFVARQYRDHPRPQHFGFTGRVGVRSQRFLGPQRL